VGRTDRSSLAPHSLHTRQTQHSGKRMGANCLIEKGVCVHVAVRVESDWAAVGCPKSRCVHRLGRPPCACGPVGNAALKFANPLILSPLPSFSRGELSSGQGKAAG